MSEMDDKLNAILSNPQMMQQIMNLANSLNQSSQEESKPAPPIAAQGFNPSMLGRVSSLMQKGTIDKNQQTLLKALMPYLSQNKLQKLEHAMHAAKMAGLASELLGNRGGKPYPGR